MPYICTIKLINLNNHIMTTFENLLGQDGNLAFNIAVFDRFSTIGDSSYSEICGSFIEGVYQWATHNIEYVDRTENAKYVGWVIMFENGVEGKVFIERRILEITPKNWGHAKNLFNKYLKKVPQH